MTELLRIPPEARVEGAATAGMVREEAIATDRTWAGLVRTPPGVASGWHHHADYETTVYVLSGTIRMESGPGGRVVAEAGPGDFLFVPGHTIHRESNPGDGEGSAIVVRSGTGEAVVNVEGPEPADG